MLLDDVATYIAASTSHGLTVATSAGGNLYKVPLPVAAPSGLCASIVEYGGAPGIRVMSTGSLNAPIFENVTFQVMVRDNSTDFQAARNTVESVYCALDGLARTRLDGTTSGPIYDWIEAQHQPYFLSYDENGRPRFVVNFSARKERG